MGKSVNMKIFYRVTIEFNDGREDATLDFDTQDEADVFGQSTADKGVRGELKGIKSVRSNRMGSAFLPF